MQQIKYGMGDKFANFLNNLSTFVSAITIGLVTDWKLTLIMFSFAPLIFILGALHSRVSKFISKLKVKI